MVRTHLVAASLICMTALTALTSFQVRAQEIKIPQSKVPSAVLSAFAKSYPKARIRATAREREGTLTYYEIESSEGKAVRDLLYTEDGTLAEVEETIAADTLPEAVRGSISKEAPNATITRAERVTRKDALTYEIHLAVRGAKGSMLIDPSGKVLKKSLPGLKSQKHSAGGDEND